MTAASAILIYLQLTFFHATVSLTFLTPRLHIQVPTFSVCPPPLSFVPKLSCHQIHPTSSFRAEIEKQAAEHISYRKNHHHDYRSNYGLNPPIAREALHR